MKYRYYYYTAIGKVAITQEEDFIIQLGLIKDDTEMEWDEAMEERQTPLLEEAAGELYDYLEGKRKLFDLPLKPTGTPFQRSVWNALLTIPYGETRTYGDIATIINCPKGFRAVGLANNRNPIMIVIPCHRVIGANGKLVGYGGGLDVKEQLLRIEGWY